MKFRTMKALELSELSILSIHAAAKILHIDDDEVKNLCDAYRQTQGRDGIKCFSRGIRTCIRAGALLEWMNRLESEEAEMVA